MTGLARRFEYFCKEEAMKRIMIFGASGSGKSTLARELGAITGLPVVHIDPMYWKPGWVQRDTAETAALVRAAMARDKWVFDGNHHATFAERIARADTVVFLDFPTVLRLWRVILRTLRFLGRTRPDMEAGCPERFNGEFIFKWVAGYRRRSYARDLEVVNTLPERITCHHIKSRRALRRFLDDTVKRYDQT